MLSEISGPPQPIKDPLLELHPLSKNFLNNIRQYNMIFQMTYFDAKQVCENNFMPTFKTQGQIYHLIDSLFLAQGNSPQYLQIYFISDSDQLSLRSNIASNLKIKLINQWQRLLHENNIYICSFKYNF